MDDVLDLGLLEIYFMIKFISLKFWWVVWIGGFMAVVYAAITSNSAAREEARHTYLRQTLPYFKTYETVNTFLKKDAEVALIGVADQYYLERRAFRLDPLYGDSLIPWTTEIRSEDALLSYLLKRGVSFGIWKVGSYHSIDPDCYKILSKTWVGSAYEITRKVMEENTAKIFEANGYRLVRFYLPKNEINISTVAPAGFIRPAQQLAIKSVEAYHNTHLARK